MTTDNTDSVKLIGEGLRTINFVSALNIFRKNRRERP
jgi:hypothetical protein